MCHDPVPLLWRTVTAGWAWLLE